jgi:hypothetical protein
VASGGLSAAADEVWKLWGEHVLHLGCGAGYYTAFTGARDPEIGSRLAAAFRRDRGISVMSLRRAPVEPDETCWLAGEGWWLSPAEIDQRGSTR